MKGVLLHGGSGTRLRPLTYTDVKQLLPIAGKPISEYAIGNLIEIGIKDINIVVGSVGAEEVKNYYGDGSKWNVHITYTYQEKPLGIAHAILLTEHFIGDDDFIVFLGDNFLQNGLKKLNETYSRKNYDGMLALVPVKDPSRFGVAEVDGKRIVRLVEKPKDPKSNLAIAGVYFLKPFVFDIIRKLKPSWRNEYEITEAYQMMVDEGYNIGYEIISGWFKDTGTVDDFIDCNRLVLDKIAVDYSALKENVRGRVIMGDNVEISDDSVVMGPCYIGSNTKISRSYIGPYTSIGNNCSIDDTEIEDSVIMDNAVINTMGSKIRTSLIGSNSRILHSDNNKGALRLILGRDSAIWI